MRPLAFISVLLISHAAGLLEAVAPALAQQRPAADLRPIDNARLAAAGIRRLASRNLVLYTDLPADPEVDRLPAVFDQAVPQWAVYFGVDEAKARAWQAYGFLIKDRERFAALGLMPPRGEDQFINGISRGASLWLVEQPTAYYRRHLLLHEGTHAFMASLLGGCGPGWYMEGTAELLATHLLDESTGQLALRVMPRRREEVPMLGRIELIEEARTAGRTLGLPAVMQIDNRRLLENESYAWCWSLAVFLDSHPRYRERFRNLRRYVTDQRFNDIVRREFADEWLDVCQEWQAFVASLDHGFDFDRMAIDFRRGEALRRGARQTVAVDAARGWQSSRVRLEAGQSYRLAAVGRFQIAEETTATGEKQPWPCEPGGVTIEYYAGRPLGILLAAIAPNRLDSANSATAKQDSDGRENAGEVSFLRPAAVGLGTAFTSPLTGTLFLRLNDAPDRLHDNRGMVSVTIEQIPETSSEVR